jgi:UDP-glucose 4-epimerase
MSPMTEKRVLITGLSSFTGAHIARAFVDAGCAVAAPLTRSLAEYETPEIKERIKYSGVSHLVENCAFGSENFIKFMKHFEPQVLINHGAPIKNYRKPDFDVKKCVSESTLQLDVVCTLLADFDGKMLHTGSLFEKDLELEQEAYSAYGSAKTEVWEKIKSAASHEGLPLHKIVIPDPIGPFENKDRLATVFFHKWKKGEKVEVHNPEFVWDRLPATWLAQVYVQAAQDEETKGHKIYRPSGFTDSNRAWAKKLITVFEKKSGKTCPGFVEKGDAVGSRVNTEECAELDDSEAVVKFMSEYGKWLYSV